MRINKRKINLIAIIFMLFISIIFLGSNDSATKAYAALGAPRTKEIVAEENHNELAAQQKQLAKSMSLNQEVFASASFNEDVVTIYNFVLAIRFEAESVRLNHIWKYNKTYAQVFDEMYNTGDYSVKEYYKAMSNGKVNVESVLVTESSPVTIGYTRSRYFPQTQSNPNGYLLNQKNIRRDEILNQGFSHLVSFLGSSADYKDVADYDGNGKIDSVSFIVLPNSSFSDPNWADLLWPHKSSFRSRNTYFKNSLNQNIGVSEYMMDYMGSNLQGLGREDSFMQTPRAQTAIHEIGHLIFSLPDLYVYDENFAGYEEPVSYWDIMGSSNLPRAQYMLSYMRLKAKWGNNQGFIEESQIVDITQAGDYQLKPVNHEESNNLPFSNTRTLAYKITNPDNPKQSIYIENRSTAEDAFDQFMFSGGTYLRSGLIVYLVDEGFDKVTANTVPGNADGLPYNIYVYRGAYTHPSIDALQVAAINSQNTVVGESQLVSMNGYYYYTPKLFWVEYDTPATQGSVQNHTKIENDIVIRFKSIDYNHQGITFSVEWDKFAAPSQFLGQEDFEDENLYSALIELLGKQEGEQFDAYDFIEMDFINLAKKGISSLNGFEKLKFKNNVLINLAGNNISSLGLFENFLKNTSLNIKVNLAFNNFTSYEELSRIKSGLPNITFALQAPAFNAVIWAKDNSWQPSQNKWLVYAQDYSDLYNFETNFAGFAEGEVVLNNPGNYYFKFNAKVPGLDDEQLNISVSTFTALEDVPSLEVFDMFEIENYIGVENINWQQFTYKILNENGQTILPQTISATVGNAQFAFVVESLNVKIWFEVDVVDTQAPVISLISENTIFVLKGSQLKSPKILIEDNYDNQQDMFWQTDSNLNNLPDGENVIEIYALDSSGNRSNTIDITIVVFEIVLNENIEVEVGNELNYLNAYQFLPSQYENVFEMQITQTINTNLIGLKNFELSFTNKNNVEEVFVVSGSANVVDKLAPTLQLLGSSEIFVFNGGAFELPNISAQDNYDKNLVLKTLQNVSINQPGVYEVEIYAEDSSGNISNLIEVTLIVVEASFVSKLEINLNSTVNYKNLVNIEPKEYEGDFDVEVVQEVNSLITGQQTISVKVFNVADPTINKTITATAQVKDIEAPKISFENGISQHYIYVGSSTSSLPVPVIEDNYDTLAGITIQKTGVVLNNVVGTYLISYTASDSSGNKSDPVVLTVIVLPLPIENLAPIKMSKLSTITPNTSVTFKVDTSKPAFAGRSDVVFAWFVNNNLIETTQEDFFEYSFKEMGTYEVEVRAENTDLEGNKVYSQTAQKLVIVVDKGGVLDQYSLAVIGSVAAGLVGILAVTSVIKKRRRLY